MVPIKGLFLLILFISDAMALHFFFLVKDDGKLVMKQHSHLMLITLCSKGIFRLRSALKERGTAVFPCLDHLLANFFTRLMVGYWDIHISLCDCHVNNTRCDRVLQAGVVADNCDVDTLSIESKAEAVLRSPNIMQICLLFIYSFRSAVDNNSCSKKLFSIHHNRFRSFLLVEFHLYWNKPLVTVRFSFIGVSVAKRHDQVNSIFN